MSSVWTFAQVEGRGERKQLQLEAWNAPFGRPRKGAVVKEHIKSRVQTTRYPGSNRQTRHAFGTNWEPMTLSGRWMTKAIEDRTASDIAQAWIEFLQDERTCRISWGFIESWVGYLEELELERESEHEIAWKMTFSVDHRDTVGRRPTTALLAKLADFPDFEGFSDAVKPPPKLLPDMSLDFELELELLIGLINTPSALLNNLAGRFDDLEKSTRAALQGMLGAVSGLQTASLTLYDVVMNVEIDSAILVRTAESDLLWTNYQSTVDTSITTMLADLAAFTRRIELSSQANANAKIVTARDGDTWESLSVRATGAPDNAKAIRDLAGVVYGQRPIPGEGYLVL